MQRTWKSQVSRAVGAVSLSALLVMYTRCSTVRGDSMQPTLHDGDWLFAEHYPLLEARVQSGDLVLAEHPKEQCTIIKRVTHLPGEQFVDDKIKITLQAHKYWLLGDNRLISEDSREYGPISVTHRVLSVYCPHKKSFKFHFPLELQHTYLSVK